MALQLDGTPRLEILLAPLSDVRRMCQEGSLPLGASSRPAYVAERRVQEELKRVEESSRSMEGALKVGVIFSGWFFVWFLCGCGFPGNRFAHVFRICSERAWMNQRSWI